jgi:hypothetical protein
LISSESEDDRIILILPLICNPAILLDTNVESGFSYDFYHYSGSYFYQESRKAGIKKGN